MKTFVVIAIAVAVCLVGQDPVNSYPHGAPKEACYDLYPSAHGPTTATGPAPYVVAFSSGSYQPNQSIKVTLIGLGGALFKGFLIKGLTKGDIPKDAIGFFTNPPKTAKIVCNSTRGNGATHTNNTVKSSVVFDWTAPNKVVGDIVFHFTVVRGGAPDTTVDAADYFWNISSGPLSPKVHTRAKPLLYRAEVNREEAVSSRQVPYAEEEEYHMNRKEVVTGRPRQVPIAEEEEYMNRREMVRPREVPFAEEEDYMNQMKMVRPREVAFAEEEEYMNRRDVARPREVPFAQEKDYMNRRDVVRPREVPFAEEEE